MAPTQTAAISTAPSNSLIAIARSQPLDITRLPPNGSRLSCAAKLAYSQSEFYNTACKTFSGSIGDGRRQLQALVRQRRRLPSPASPSEVTRVLTAKWSSCHTVALYASRNYRAGPIRDLRPPVPRASSGRYEASSRKGHLVGVRRRNVARCINRPE